MLLFFRGPGAVDALVQQKRREDAGSIGGGSKVVTEVPDPPVPQTKFCVVAQPLLCV
jgi:hypothetical protein